VAGVAHQAAGDKILGVAHRHRADRIARVKECGHRNRVDAGEILQRAQRGDHRRTRRRVAEQRHGARPAQRRESGGRQRIGRGRDADEGGAMRHRGLQQRVG
jgi:hypothetical protein